MAAAVRAKDRVRGEFLFVAHIAAPDGGFGRHLDAVNRSDRPGSDIRRRRQPQGFDGREFCSWLLDGLEIAKSLRHRFGGQIVPVTPQPVPRRCDTASQPPLLRNVN
jgi:hypothetical protein